MKLISNIRYQLHIYLLRNTIEQVIDSVESKIDNEENVEVVTAATKSLPKLQKLLNARLYQIYLQDHQPFYLFHLLLSQ